jgi:hypothetical protein
MYLAPLNINRNPLAVRSHALRKEGKAFPSLQPPANLAAKRWAFSATPSSPDLAANLCLNPDAPDYRKNIKTPIYKCSTKCAVILILRISRIMQRVILPFTLDVDAFP